MDEYDDDLDEPSTLDDVITKLDSLEDRMRETQERTVTAIQSLEQSNGGHLDEIRRLLFIVAALCALGVARLFHVI